MTFPRRRSLSAFACAVLLAACAADRAGAVDEPAALADAPAKSDAGATASPTRDASPATMSGVLLFATGAPITGLAFESGTHRGTTDAQGIGVMGSTPVAPAGRRFRS